MTGADATASRDDVRRSGIAMPYWVFAVFLAMAFCAGIVTAATIAH